MTMTLLPMAAAAAAAAAVAAVAVVVALLQHLGEGDLTVGRNPLAHFFLNKQNSKMGLKVPIVLW